MAKHDVIVRLHPSRLVTELNTSAAHKLPTEAIETTQDISSDDIGPVVSGESFDINSGKIGDIQP